ncbi:MULTISPECIES: hypothetical protein [Herbidospora]|uniref:hypothetical protein n=1 Tax=Herbidospora TaxID=28443 RepID=UPI00078608A9|nr:MULTISPECIES: hypothetical protein [Herbidospora]
MAEYLYIFGDEDRKKFARLIAVSWSDGELLARYEAEPRVVLGEYGIAYPEGLATPPLPARPRGEFDITEMEFAAGAENGALATISTVGCIALCHSDPR